MRQLVIFIATLSALYSCASIKPVDSDWKSQAEADFKNFTKKIHNRALVVGMYENGQDTLMSFGRINLFGRKPDGEDVFQIGSVTKTFTGYLFAKAIVDDEGDPNAPVSKFLEIKQKEKYQDNSVAGVVTGLAWTPVGGDILFIETSLTPGKGKLTLTGNLGDVMKESAMIALEYLKSHSDSIGIDPESFNNWNVHVHVPEGATPKDGPSAGMAILTALASLFSQRKVKKYLAMTGEITLRGKVLPVGGIKEKILAAKRGNIKEVVLSSQNKKDVEEINPKYIKGLNFHYVDEMIDVVDLSLTAQKVKNALKVA